MKTKQNPKLFEELVHGLAHDTLDIPDNAVIVLDPSLYAQLFTKKRLELVDYINTHHPASIQELATLVKRTKQAVDRDIKLLEQYGLVELVRTGRTVQPIVKKQLVLFNLQPAQIQRESPIEATA